MSGGQRAAILDDREHQLRHGTPRWIGCASCIEQGILLCPACLQPQRGYHLRCLPRSRWVVLALYVLGLAGLLLAGLWLLLTVPIVSGFVAVSFVLGLLAYPHRHFFRAFTGR